MNTGIISEYESKRAMYLEYEDNIKRLVNSLLKTEEIYIHAIESRVKELESLKKKINDKNKYKSINEITDILGLRLITYFEDDVDKIANLLKQEFILDKVNSVDKRAKDNPEEFGYASLHYILKLKEPRASLPEYENFKNINFEIQIRSILQHAWAEIEHDLGYKSKKEVPHSIRRDFSRVSGLLELADKEFIRIKEFLKNYGSEVENKIDENNLNILIDKITLKEYLEKSTLISEINATLNKETDFKYDLDNHYYYLETIEYFEIKTLGDLDNLLSENKNNIPKFFKRWNKGRFDTKIRLDTPILYLFYVLFYKNYKDSDFDKYAEINGFDKEPYLEIKDIFNEIKSEGFIL
ncbi:GTP pyrophosphokinase [Lysinibacillus sphaericus]|uniref:GTP pyrophosphokinase n=1 Tax=Lysinibacillus sphaericus TaxID=1421 RepID=UPI003F78DA9B